MRRIAALAATVLLTTLVLGTVQPASAAAAPPVALSGAVTDNYKAVWNADPEVRENRTWLQLQSVAVNGVTYTPASLPVDQPRVYTADQQVRGSDGSSAVVRVAAGADVVNKPFRTEATGQWGPLLVLADTSTLPEKPVRVTLSVERNGTVLGSTVVEYRYDAALYHAPRDSVEYNSPGGRFWLGCNPTRTDWEHTAPASTCDDAAAADVTVSVSSRQDLTVGTGFALTITVTNRGDVAAHDVETGSDIPAGLVVLSGGPRCSGSSVLTCDVGSLAAGASTSARVRLAPVAPGAYALNATASSNDADADPTNNTGTATMTVAGEPCTVVGTSGRDTLTGTSNRDVLCGLGGNDQLRGGAGSDVLYGGEGKDVLDGGPGDDLVDGGAGADRMTFASAAAGVTVNLAQLPHPAWDGPSAGDAKIGWDEVRRVEAVTASRFADELHGGARADRMAGAGGNDTIYGHAGNDTLVGNGGADRIFGGDGTDALNGAAGTDTCAGGGQAGDVRVSCEA